MKVNHCYLGDCRDSMRLMLDQGGAGMNTLDSLPICIIPARGGSQRIPGKNMKMFHGKPIIQYSIEKAFASKLFGKVIVSSDNPDTLAFAKEQGACASIRADAMARDDVGTQEVAQDVAKAQATMTPMVCVIYATVPLMSIDDLRSGQQMLLDFPSLEFAYATGEIDGRTVHAGQFYWSRTAALLKGLQLDEAPTGHIHIPPNRLCDINTPEDWTRAEGMYLQLKERKQL